MLPYKQLNEIFVLSDLKFLDIFVVTKNNNK